MSQAGFPLSPAALLTGFADIGCRSGGVKVSPGGGARGTELGEGEDPRRCLQGEAARLETGASRIPEGETFNVAGNQICTQVLTQTHSYYNFSLLDCSETGGGDGHYFK